MIKRSDLFASIENTEEFDIVIIGGGASGLGVTLDAISRGYKVLCVEKDDYGKGTSSKATKLLHGGVRYLAQGDIPLVYEALRERTTIIENAPHNSESLPFIIPIYNWFDALKFFIGLTFYDILAGSKSLGGSRWLSKKEVINILPNIKTINLKGGVRYMDGQFDDSRLCIDVVNTIISEGGICLNYCEFTEFIEAEQGFNGVTISDKLSGKSYSIKTKSIVNATGVYFEKIINKQKEQVKLKIVPSRGSNIVIDRSFLASDSAIMIPKTSDGRVLFIIPWKNVCIVGTTDKVSDKVESDPKATEEDIKFILNNAQEYLIRKPTHKDIKSTFAGLRPLAAPKGDGQKTKEISRSHKVLITNYNLFSLLGGKWTSFRKMGYDTVNKIIKKGILKKKPSNSINLKIKEKSVIEGDFIHHLLPYSWAYLEHIIKQEYVVKLEDLLARRTRCLFIDKQATLDICDKALSLMARVNKKEEEWIRREKIDFLKFAESF